MNGITYQLAVAETPADDGNVGLARGFYVGVTGNVSVVCKNGSTAVFVAVPAGEIIPIEISRVNATGTTASSILVLY